MIIRLILISLIFLGLELPVGADSEVDECSYSSVCRIAFVTTTLKKEGYKIPSNFTCSNDIAKILLDSTDVSNIQGLFSYTYSLVYLNNESFDADLTLLHEIGHYNHFLKLGAEKYNSMRSDVIDEEIKPLISKTIGNYATTNKLEFVAEMFAYKHYGLKFPEKLEKYYKECKGI